MKKIKDDTDNITKDMIYSYYDYFNKTVVYFKFLET